MKLIVFACLLAVALARPDELPRRQFRRPVRPQQQSYEPETYDQQTYNEPEPYDQQTYTEPEATYEPQAYEKPRSRQRQTYAEPEPKSFSRGPAYEELSESRRRDRDAVITSFTNEHTDGGARHSYKADNGLEREETIQLREVVTVDEYGDEVVKTVPVYKGSFQFLMDDGSLVTRSYTTDETGRLIWEGSDLPREGPQPQPQPAAYE